MDFKLTQAQQLLHDSCTAFANAEIQPRIREFEQAHSIPPDLLKKMAAEGLLLMNVPAEAGGSRKDSICYTLAMSAIAKADAGIAVTMSVTNMVGETLVKYGTEKQQQKYFPQIAAGAYQAAFAVTESMAGSDAAALRTRADLDPADNDYYILNGEKTFITSGDIAGLTIVFANVDRLKGYKGITAFLVESGHPGFSVGKPEDKLGQISSSTVSIAFENCRVHCSQILGDVGAGLKIALNALNSGRMGIAALSTGIAEAAYEAALQYVQRHQALKESQTIRFKLVDMKTKIEAARLMTFRAAWLKDQNQPFMVEGAMAKMFATEKSNEIVAAAVEICGVEGCSENYLIEKYFRDARVTTIYEGTSEIQRIVIARQLVDAV